MFKSNYLSHKTSLVGIIMSAVFLNPYFFMAQESTVANLTPTSQDSLHFLSFLKKDNPSFMNTSKQEEAYILTSEESTCLKTPLMPETHHDSSVSRASHGVRGGDREWAIEPEMSGASIITCWTVIPLYYAPRIN